MDAKVVPLKDDNARTRLRELLSLQILETSPEERFDHYTHFLAYVSQTRIDRGGGALRV